ncbi:hypothetical protein INT45_006268 [Circinella minor]|uniref:Major facilitator superfamily (MFS) profile domain-containing protein n=1 Tax=Circinella minor TaxID=1195481 RepID=A0A8H7S066_9FUNG|nr:hypothetical protein INT45_006268 [Circinella minor]
MIKFFSNKTLGRRPVFILSNFFAVAGNIGSALAGNIHTLIGVQIISAVGAAAAYALGVGIISDIFKDHEKGRALSWNAAMNPYSMAVAPLVGGVLTQYFGWRSIFWFFVIAYSLLWIAIVILLPETSNSEQRSDNKAITSYDNEKNKLETTKKKRRMINPFSSLKLLRFPNMLMVCVYLGIIGFTNNVMGISFAWAYSNEYHFTSTLVGFFYLAGLIGNTAGTWLGGCMSDKIYMRRVTKAQENNQEIFPEMRLSQLGVFMGIFSMACSFVTYGWCIEKQVHFSVGIICQVFGKDCLF